MNKSEVNSPQATSLESRAREIVTIDGPAGAGKSTLARQLAQALDWRYLDTGALYRSIAFCALREGLGSEDQDQVEELARQLPLTLTSGAEGTVVELEDEDLTPHLRTPLVTQVASVMAAWPGVRAALLGLQKDLGQEGKVVAEGRDMGSVVFPEAGRKFYLWASAEARAKRRCLDLEALGQVVVYEKVLADIEARDQADYTRSISPLTIPPGAIKVDSTSLTPKDVLALLMDKCAEVGFLGELTNNKF